ncbi:hypothetical protein D9M68_971180 [compost metagenome]
MRSGPGRLDASSVPVASVMSTWMEPGRGRDCSFCAEGNRSTVVKATPTNALPSSNTGMPKPSWRLPETRPIRYSPMENFRSRTVLRK